MSEEQLAESAGTYSHFFTITLSLNKAECKLCNVNFKYDQQKSGTNSLKRHLQNKHPKAYIAKQRRMEECSSTSLQPTLIQQGFVSMEKIVELPKSRKYILGMVCSKHILPFDFLEDPIVSSCFDLPVIRAKMYITRFALLQKN